MGTKFVVIGSDGTFGTPRTVKYSLDEGIEHARDLLVSRNQAPGTELLVVEVRAVVKVEKPTPPISVIRLPRSEE